MTLSVSTLMWTPDRRRWPRPTRGSSLRSFSSIMLALLDWYRKRNSRFLCLRSPSEPSFNPLLTSNRPLPIVRFERTKEGPVALSRVLLFPAVAVLVLAGIGIASDVERQLLGVWKLEAAAPVV